MTREQAQVYAKLSREDIEKIDKGYAKHYDMLCAFANGEEIEEKHRYTMNWFTTELPYFYPERDYRVKPSAEQRAEKLKPKKGEKLFYVSAFGIVKPFEFDGSIESNIIIDFGNYFRTREEAEAARERVFSAINKETLSKMETVESLDGHKLSDAEKGVIRVLRRCKVETMWNCDFVYPEGHNALTVCESGVLLEFESGTKACEFGDLDDDIIAEAKERREKGEPSW